MWRLIYTRYRPVCPEALDIRGLELCRWRWAPSRLSRAGRVRFPEWPDVEWEAVEDYQSAQRSPDAPDAALPPRPKKHRVLRRNDPVQRQLLMEAFSAGLSYQEASRHASVSLTAAQRAYQGFRRAATGEVRCGS